MKYFRYFPWGLQLLLFLLMVFTLISSAAVIVSSIFTKVTGFTPEQLAAINPTSPLALINAAVMLQGISSIIIFLFSPLLFAYLSTPRPAQYLGLRLPGKPIHFILVIFIMLGAMPVLEKIQELISYINFGSYGKSVKAAQEVSDNTFNAFLTMNSFGSFLKVFFIMAIIPAVGEELFFRGVLLRFSKQKSRTMLTPILFTAAVFAFTHSNIYGYLSIFLAGVLLAVIYNLTGSIWCSILGHLFFNGTQIILTYAANFNLAIKTFMSANSVSLPLVAGGAAIFAVSFYLLLKNKTPLPANWSDNFTPEELYQKSDQL